MIRKKIDNRVRVMIENNIKDNMRSFFVIVGDRAKNQIPILHHIMSKATVKARPTVLWCYKQDLGFTSNRKKMERKMKGGNVNVRDEDPLELFISSTEIRYCYYKETTNILGNTYGMCILQDFEALTPNTLARTIETVEGGGCVCILLKTVKSLKQLYTMSMDVHLRYRGHARRDVTARFNERFILSLATCSSCLVVDDDLNVLPISSTNQHIAALVPKTTENEMSSKDKELKELKTTLQDTQPVGVIVNLCKTTDQAHAVLKFVEAISEKTLRSTVALTAARGRGKSAALGLAMASAVAFGYSNIFVTSPSPENLRTLFDFVFKGFDALKYAEHIDYDIAQSTHAEFNKAIVRVNIFREHRQTIQYIHPSDAHKLGQAELVVIDEAAAIPLPLVKALLGPYLVFMSSTVNGYEGTGRSLSLKLIKQLRQQCSVAQSVTNEDKSFKSTTSGAPTGRVLHEITLNESIRYAEHDPVEAWLNKLLCLDAGNVYQIGSGCPSPDMCTLYYINRDTLFSYHNASEAFLQRIMSLFVSSHYKNTPNDLQMLSDSPSQHIFVLLPPIQSGSTTLPEVLCVLQVALEGEIAKEAILQSLNRGVKASGDLIPWTLSQQFQEHDFPGLSGARVVRIATHPDYQQMGYGRQALLQLQQYYEGNFPNLNEEIENVPEENKAPEVQNVSDTSLVEEQIGPRQNLPPLLAALNERPAENLDYLGVSYGLTSELYTFWKKCLFIPVYIRQTENDLTGEHSCIMLKLLNEQEAEGGWLQQFNSDFRNRFMSLMSFQFSKYSPSLALNIIQTKISSSKKQKPQVLSISELDLHLSKFDMKRLEMYSRKLVDHHLIMDLIPTIAKLFFTERLAGVKLSLVQKALLLGVGLQHKTVDNLEKELDLPSTQLLGIYNKIIRKCFQSLNAIVELQVGETVPKFTNFLEDKGAEMEAEETGGSVDINHEAMKDTRLAHEMLRHEAKQAKSQKVVSQLLSGALKSFQSYKIKGTDDEWQNALSNANDAKLSVRIKGVAPELKETLDNIPDEDPSLKGKGKKKAASKRRVKGQIRGKVTARDLVG